jgi:hypothetical protein
MPEGAEDAIKKNGDHNWHMERIQFRKNEGTFQAKITMLNKGKWSLGNNGY